MTLLKIREDLDFSFNPDNVTVGDWVASKTIGYDKVGQIKAIVTQREKMLQFWVMWSGETSTRLELADNLKKIEPIERDYVGEKLKGGRVVYLHYLKEEDRVIAEVWINGETDYWNIDKLQFNLNNLHPDETIALDTVIIDENLQQRVKINFDVVNDYATAYKNGEKMPPITIWYCTDDHKTYLVDGFHRAEGAFAAGINHLPFLRKEGTYREALLFSLGVNASHGLRRSNADKRKAVMTLLTDFEWNKWSDRHIAKKCGVSNRFVSNLRKQFIHTDYNPNEDGSNLTVNVHSHNPNEDGSNLTGNVNSYNPNEDGSNLTVNVHSHNLNEDDGNPTVNIHSHNLNERTYLTKDGTTAKMNITNIGKSKQTESLPPTEGNEIIDDVMVETSDSKTDVESLNDKAVETCDNQVDNKLKDLSSSSRNKNKRKLVNPLSVGDKVTVKKDHYFGGQNGVVTQTSSSSTVIVALDNGERNLFNLTDLDLSASRSKPIVMNSKGVKKPVKKEIHLTEGCNYKAGLGESRDTCEIGRFCQIILTFKLKG